MNQKDEAQQDDERTRKLNAEMRMLMVNADLYDLAADGICVLANTANWLVERTDNIMGEPSDEQQEKNDANRARLVAMLVCHLDQDERRQMFDAAERYAVEFCRNSLRVVKP